MGLKQMKFYPELKLIFMKVISGVFGVCKGAVDFVRVITRTWKEKTAAKAAEESENVVMMSVDLSQSKKKCVNFGSISFLDVIPCNLNLFSILK